MAALRVLNIFLRRWLKITRFTDRLRFLMLGANLEAINAGASEITPAHFYEAMVYEGSGVGITLLRHCGLQDGNEEFPFNARLVSPATTLNSTPRLPLDDSLEQLVKAAIEEANGLGDDYVGTEHMALALAGMENGPLHTRMSAKLTVEILRETLVQLRKME